MKIILIAAMTVPDLVIGRTTKNCPECGGNGKSADWRWDGLDEASQTRVKKEVERVLARLHKDATK